MKENTEQENNEVLLINHFNSERLPENYLERYLVHIVCLEGCGKFSLSGQNYTVQKNDFVIWLPPNDVSDLMFSPDFKAEILLITEELINRNTPDLAWSISASLYARENFLLPLIEAETERCIFNFKLLYQFYENRNHRFYTEVLDLQMQIFRLEMWDIFSAGIERRKNTVHGDSIFERFMHFLQVHSLTEREVKFYSDRLFITPKYLSEVCKKNSNKNASQWIQEFSRQRLTALLRNKNLSFSDISDAMNFSSQSFFSKYVKKVLGVSPSSFRSRLG